MFPKNDKARPGLELEFGRVPNYKFFSMHLDLQFDYFEKKKILFQKDHFV